MSDGKSRIRYRRNESELEVEGSEIFVIEQFNNLLPLVLGEVTLNPTAETSVGAGIEVEDQIHGTTLTEFYKMKNPSNHNERIMVFVYWLSKTKGKRAISIDDVLVLYKTVSEKPPKNPSQHFTANVKDAYLQRLDDGLYGMTSSGATYVEDTLPNSGE